MEDWLALTSLALCAMAIGFITGIMLGLSLGDVS